MDSGLRTDAAWGTRLAMIRRVLDLQRLRYFAVLADECHFGRAAKRLHLAQPSLTEQIQRLEKDLGARLFYRKSRGVTLTSAGRVLADRVGRLLAEADDLEQLMKATQKGFLGSLTVGFQNAQAYTILPPVLRAFHGEYPSIEVVPRQMGADRELDAVADHLVDANFLCSHDHEALTARAKTHGVSLDLLTTEPFVLALPRSHPLAMADHIAPVDLAVEPFVFRVGWKEMSINAAVQAVCRSAGFEPRVVAEVTDMNSLMALVASGVGVALVSASFASLEHYEIAFRPLPEAHACSHLFLASRAKDTNPLVANFRRIACATLAEPALEFARV
jgi:DNA-binding transcriptional LysR family regulator